MATTGDQSSSVLTPAPDSSVPAPQLDPPQPTSSFAVRFDQDALPGVTVVEVQGSDQENLIADVTAVFSSMGMT